MKKQEIKQILKNHFEKYNYKTFKNKDFDEIVDFIEQDIDSKEDLDHILDDLRIFESFQSYINYMYHDSDDYQGASGPAIITIDNLTQMVETGYHIINVEDALIVDPDNTSKLPGEPDKFIVIL